MPLNMQGNHSYLKILHFDLFKNMGTLNFNHFLDLSMRAAELPLLSSPHLR